MASQTWSASAGAGSSRSRGPLGLLARTSGSAKRPAVDRPVAARSAPRGGRRGAWRRSQTRRVAAAVLLGAGVWSAITAFAPSEPPRERAVAAADDLSAGHVLTASDLTLVPVDPAAAPASRLADVAAGVGQTLAAPLERGEIVTAPRLRPATALAGLPLGERAVHVPLSDKGALPLVRPGDRVDVVAVATGQSVGAGLLVLSVDQSVDGGSGVGGGGGEAAGGLVLAVPPSDVGRLVAAAGSGGGDGVQLALRPAPARA